MHLRDAREPSIEPAMEKGELRLHPRRASRRGFYYWRLDRPIVARRAVRARSGAAGALSRSYFRPVVIEAPKEIDLGELDSHSAHFHSIPVRNVSTSTAIIIGAKTSCPCSVVDGLPVTINPGQSHTIVIKVAPPPGENFSGAIVLFVNTKTSTSVQITFRAKIRTKKDRLVQSSKELSTVHCSELSSLVE